MPSNYTFTQKKQPGSDLSSHFNTLAVDGAHQAMQGVTGNGFQTSDATATPVVSPVSVLISAVTTLITPDSGAQLNILAATNPVLISEADATVASKYISIPAGVPIQLDVAKTQQIYLKATGGTSVVSFWYNIV
jgi:hypothetical protein